MTAAPSPAEPRTRPSAEASGRAGLVLALIVTCQLMIVLDATVVNVALPPIPEDLGFSATGLSWVVNAYTLAFGGLLLLGGRGETPSAGTACPARGSRCSPSRRS